MHILLVNDDGPPSEQSSPYIHSFVKSLQEGGHVVSVCLPHTQRSWIGKAHFVGQSLKPVYYRPGSVHKNDGTTHSRPLPPGSKPQEEWILIDGTPASCVQIGLYHFFQDLGPIDLVISGPNYGRNSTAIFALSSGTLGGALEAAACKKKAIAISYAFESRNHDFDAIDATSKHAVRVIGHLYENWSAKVDVYSVNIPVCQDVASRKILRTNMLQNNWGPYSCFEEVEDENGDPDEEEQRIREQEGAQNGDYSTPIKHKHKHFKWAPKFTDVHKSVRESEPGNDGWALQQGFVSITPIIANFWHAELGMEGEIKLPLVPSEIKELRISERSCGKVYAIIDFEDDYVQPLILSSLTSRFQRGSYTIVTSGSAIPDPSSPTLHIRAYEQLPFEDILTYPKSCLANAYMIRKALIRKNYLLVTVRNWISKHPSSILATNFKPSCDFELDYAEFLDDSLVEAWELQTSFRKNEGKDPSQREWWILKPGMSDRGQGIRLFSSQEELQAIFEDWEAAQSDSEGEDESADLKGDEQAHKQESKDRGDYIMTSHLRHFIAQPYIHPPLLLPLPNNPSSTSLHKFHIRTYVLAVGSLKVYIYKPMLALFASTPYSPPWTASSSSEIDLSAHLTNTCSQDPSNKPSTVQLFWSLPPPPLPSSSHLTSISSSPPLASSWKQSIFTQICSLTGEVFEAAARSMTIHFQTLPNAFEVFGLDFLVDESGQTWLLEVNAFPDFAQTGDELRGVVAGLWDGVVDCAVKPFFGIGGDDEGAGHGTRNGSGGYGEMVLVRELDLGRE